MSALVVAEPAAAAPALQVLRIGGVHVERGGSGAPLVLVHGIGSHTGMWKPVLPMLLPRRDVIALDLPGFGRSGVLPEGVPAVPATYAAVVAAVLDELGLRDAHVAGNSLGGWVALDIARQGRARSVVALSPAGFWGEFSARYSRALLKRSRGLAQALLPLAPRLLASPAGRKVVSAQFVVHGERIPTEDALEAARMLATSHGWDRTVEDMTAVRVYTRAELRCPVTIAWGEHDRVLPRSQLRRAAELVPNARLRVLRGCGHVPTWDDPEQVAEVLLSYDG